MSFISKPMGWLLAQLSELFADNFALSVLVFTILVNIIMLPLTLKSQKSTAKQARVKHKLDALKKKFGDDRQKYNQAMQELYNKEGISMGGGCLPMVVRLLVMIGVYTAVVSPFTYVAGIDAAAIESAKLGAAYVNVIDNKAITDDVWNKLGLEAKLTDAKVIEKDKADDNKDATFYAKYEILRGVTDKKAKNEIKKDTPEEAAYEIISKNAVLREVELADYLTEGKPKYCKAVKDDFVAKNGNIEDFNKIDFNFFGIDLTEDPDFSWKIFGDFQVNWLIPIASFVAALASGVVSQMIQKKTNPEAPNMMAMMLFMPLFSLYIAFSAPCALGFYWAISSIVSGALQILTQKFYGPAVVNAKEQAKGIVFKAKQEQERISRIDSAVVDEQA
ncbi:MAG: YidC/Oxa1 family membrane protein insertase [Clostridia bacterium]|nr:YidC/Oxa1 family membrane protein insertase [Clostridia bacterium]